MDLNEENYGFVYINKTFESISGKQNKDYLMKW